MGKDPGVKEIEGEEYPYPGSVAWRENGLRIALYSDDLPLEKLLSIAESIP